MRWRRSATWRRIVNTARLGLLVALLASMPAVHRSLLAAQEAPAGEISFGFWGDPAEARAYQAIVDAFEALHPAVTVQIEYVPDANDFYARLATGYAAGDSPDVFLINYRRYGQFAAAGALEPVGPYLAGSAAIAADDYYPEPMAAFTFNGELMCLPQNLSSLVVYYNRDLFDAAEVPYPGPDWTWSDFLAAAQMLTQDTDGDGVTDQVGIGIEPSLVRVAPFIWQAGGDLVDDLDHPTRLTIDAPEARAGMQFVLDLSLVHRVVPTESDVLVQSLEDRFMDGTMAMLFQSRRVVPSLRQIDDFTWDVAPLPRQEEAAGILHADAYCLSAGADHKAVAWTFIEFANGRQGQAIAAEVGRTVPSLRQIAESPVFLGPTAGVATGTELDQVNPPASARVFLDAGPDLRRLPATATWPEIEQAFNDEFSLAFYGRQSLDAAIAAILERTAEPFRRSSERRPS